MAADGMMGDERKKEQCKKLSFIQLFLALLDNSIPRPIIKGKDVPNECADSLLIEDKYFLFFLIFFPSGTHPLQVP